MVIDVMQANAEQASSLLKSLANPARLLVLCALLDRAHTAGELEELVGLSQSALSQHLARLRKEKLVTTRRDGQKIFYSLDDNDVRCILEALHSVYCRDL